MENLIFQIVLSDGYSLKVYRDEVAVGASQAEANKAVAAGGSVALVKPHRSLSAWAGSVPVYFRELPSSLEALAEETAASGYERYGDRFHMSFKAIASHVRHRYTNYEALLRQLERMPGGRDAHDLLKDRVDRLVVSTLNEVYGEFPMAS